MVLSIETAPKGGKAKKHAFLEHLWFFGRGAPGLQTTTWPNTLFGIPLNPESLEKDIDDFGPISARIRAAI
jgi:hypothetical protein